jgi:hypothetical protein
LINILRSYCENGIVLGYLKDVQKLVKKSDVLVSSRRFRHRLST